MLVSLCSHEMFARHVLLRTLCLHEMFFMTSLSHDEQFTMFTWRVQNRFGSWANFGSREVQLYTEQVYSYIYKYLLTSTDTLNSLEFDQIVLTSRTLSYLCELFVWTKTKTCDVAAAARWRWLALEQKFQETFAREQCVLLRCSLEMFSREHAKCHFVFAMSFSSRELSSWEHFVLMEVFVQTTPIKMLNSVRGPLRVHLQITPLNYFK